MFFFFYLFLQATGTRVGTLLESFVSMFLVIIISFVFSWLVTLVVLGVVPLIILAGAFQTQIFTSHATKIKKDLENAGKIAVDSIDHVRTVASLTVEEKFTTMYTAEVTRPYKSSIRIHPLSYGFTYAFSQAIIFFMYAIVFRFGGFLVNQDPDSFLHEDFEDIFIVFMSIIFGAISIGQASAFAPNYAKAKLSANRIFALLDREPIIDNYSQEGQKLVSGGGGREGGRDGREEAKGGMSERRLREESWQRRLRERWQRRLREKRIRLKLGRMR